jgi:hypothetical protein
MMFHTKLSTRICLYFLFTTCLGNVLNQSIQYSSFLHANQFLGRTANIIFTNIHDRVPIPFPSNMFDEIF